jgi:integrase
VARQSKPWFRKACNRWYFTVGDTQHPLDHTDPNDFAGAMRKMMEQLNKMAALDPDAVAVRDGMLGELLRDYLPVVARRVESKTLTDYARHLNWFVGRFGRVPVGRLRAEDVEDAAATEGWSDNTRRTCLSVCRGFVRWCGRSNFRLKCPPERSRGAEVVVSPDEFEKLLAGATGDFKPLLRFWWLTGCRPGEACGLTVEGVDWQHGTVTVRKHKTSKKGKVRVLFLCPESLAVLVDQRARYGSGLLFRNQRGWAFARMAVVKRMERLRDRAGVRGDIIAYSMRHTFATRALERGESDSEVAALLGHSSTAQIHKTYSHLSSSARRLKEVAARVNKSG